MNPSLKTIESPVFLLELLLGAQVVGVSAAAFAAVGGARRKTRVTLSANHLLAVVFLGQHAKRRLDDSSPQSQDQMKRGLFLNVVIGERASILELFAGEDETLLIGRNAFFVLDLGFDVFDAVAGLHFQRDRLARQRLHENLHLDVLGCCGDTK